MAFAVAACTQKSPAPKRDRVADEKHSVVEELGIFTQLESLPSYLDSASTYQVSSYDTTGGNDDGFSGRYSFQKRFPDSSLLIFDVKGKGVINRIWTPTPSSDTLDFYFDGSKTPAFSIAFVDLFSGKQYPFVEPLCGNQLGGFYCYLPIPFENGCRIISRGKRVQFHQIQYRIYSDSKPVKTFSLNFSQEEKAALQRISVLWGNNTRTVADFYREVPKHYQQEFEIVPNETITLFELEEGGRLLGMELTPASAWEGLRKNFDLKITWDNEATPAVLAPVSDFFGYAFGKPSMQALVMGTKGNINYCYLPMPFDHAAKIEMIYRSDGTSSKPIQVGINVWYTPEKRSMESEGKFYAAWNRHSEKGKPHQLLEVKGKGHYVGSILQAQGLQAGMTYFFEGDDSTVIDGALRLHGTGSEDYFNGGWYAMMDRWDGAMSLPLHGALDYSLPFGRTGGYRFFLSDKMIFQRELLHTIEHGPAGNKFPVDYTSLGLYYSNTPPSEVEIPTPELTRVFLPDTLFVYPQLMDYNLYGGIQLETTWKYGTGGESYRFTPGVDSWVRISLNEIPAGNYTLYFDIMKEPDGCDFSVWQRQTQRTGWISAASATEVRDQRVVACELTIKDFQTTITLRFKTDTRHSAFLLNRLMLIRK
jgi:hypothetical protein